MSIEIIVGPILALLVSMKFTKYTDDQRKKAVSAELQGLRTELVNKADLDQSKMAKQVLVTVSPIAKAVREVKETLGV